MAFVNCGVCKVWLIDQSTGDYLKTNGQYHQRPMAPDCQQCPKGEAGFAGRSVFNGRLSACWSQWCLLKAHGVLPEAGGMADQDAAFVDAVCILDSLFAEREQNEADRLRVKNGR